MEAIEEKVRTFNQNNGFLFHAKETEFNGLISALLQSIDALIRRIEADEATAK
jgi:hypothetical protein